MSMSCNGKHGNMATAHGLARRYGTVAASGILAHTKPFETGMVPLEQLLERAERHVLPNLLPGRLLGHSADAGSPFATGFITEFMKKNIKTLIATGHPFLNTVNAYYVNSGGKGLRPVILLLLGGALDRSRESSYRRLAEITEMIHIASLLHDDVLDGAHARRHSLSAPLVFGNKATILSGDYLLATASLELAKLGNSEVVESMATSLSDLVQGEFMQLDVPPDKKYDMGYYTERIFRKTASLIAQSCRSIGLLTSASHTMTQSLFNFGKHFGIAFQLLDDLLDYQSDTKTCGKTTCYDIKNGILTAPILFSMKTHRNILEPIIDRSCTGDGDVPQLLDIVCNQTSAIRDTWELAQEESRKAVESLSMLEESIEKTLLLDLVKALLYRIK